jgi:hypothetical protein
MKRFNLIYFLFATVLHATLTAGGVCCRTECTPEDSCDFEVTSRTFLADRPVFLSSSPVMISGFRSDRLHARPDGWHGAAQAVVFGSKSTNDRDLARYFFPNGKTELIIDERIGLTVPPLPQDLLAQHFNIFTRNGTFRSKISIRPETSQVGVGFYLRKGFYVDEQKGRGFFTSISLPVERVKNDLKFQEEIINDGGGADFQANVDNNAYDTMTAALVQSDWAAGKISRFALHKAGVADIEFKLGYEWIQQEPFHLESYLGLLIPTGNKPNGEFLFQPIVGQGHHWGILLGNSIGVEIWSDETKDRTLRVEYAGHTQYLFRNTQCRTVDLVNKPWSRYIQMYSDENQALAATFLSASDFQTNYSTPGVNLLTLPIHVRPGFSNNNTVSAIFSARKWQVEGGYNLYCRASECLKLECPWQEGPAIKNKAGNGDTNPVRDITGNARLENITVNNTAGTGNRISLGDYKFNFIKEADLNLNSAASPGIISHTVYASLGYNCKDREIPLFGNLGGSYEFSNSNNAVIERWTIWAKAGLSF